MLMLYPEFLISNVEQVTQSIATIISANTTGGFIILEEMCTLQLDDTIVGKLLRAKETNQKPTDAYIWSPKVLSIII